MSFLRIFHKAHDGLNLSKEDLITLLSANESQTKMLFTLADSIRQHTVGQDVHLRALIEFSNYCKQNCLYCGLRSANKNIKRYRLSEEEIISTAKQAANLGYKTVVLQSGEDCFFTPEIIANIVKRIKKFDIAVTLSLGEYSYEVYKLWKDAGADRYLIKHETSDPNLYGQIRPSKTLLERLRCQKWLKELGYQLGSGCMIGIPGQTLDILAEDLLTFKKMNADMIGIGPFIPHPETPLKHNPIGSWEFTLKMLAVTRILLPDVHLPATTALETVFLGTREKALKAGANVIMPNFSPERYRKYYEIYPNKYSYLESPEVVRKELITFIESLERTVGQDEGHCLNFIKKSI